VRSRIRNIFERNFREEDFISKLSDTIASYSALAKSTGFGQAYQNFSNFWSDWKI
jgi:hypothetical protein